MKSYCPENLFTSVSEDALMMFLSKIFLLDYLKEPFKILNKREGGFCLFSSQHLLFLLLLCTKYYALS